MMIRPATEQDIPAITAIFNEAVVNSNAIWTEKQDTEAERLAWMKARLALGYPVLAGWSRKSSLGHVTGCDVPSDRVMASVAAALLAVERGARVVRVHDVRQTVDALKVWQASLPT